MTHATVFAQSFGRWAGTAEVFSGEGCFLGNGADARQVQDLGNGRTRIDVSFVGPFKHSGHYFIQNEGDHRLYQGPANVGYAEVLSDSLVDANAYWAALGMSQRFFLMVLPDGQTQLSLALMSRGEQLLYVVVGENQRVPEGEAAAQPVLVSGSAYDFANDPAAGRSEILLHRAGVWRGELTILDAARKPQGIVKYSESVKSEKVKGNEIKSKGLDVTIKGGFAEDTFHFSLFTNNWQAWTPAGNTVGSYSLSGGRALSGHFHHLEKSLRVWRREVVSHDGTQKAVVQHWYRGSERVAIQFGVLRFAKR